MFRNGLKPIRLDLSDAVVTSRNLGTFDAALRVVFGLVLIALANAGTIGEWGFIGMVPILTAVAGSCPIYRFLRISSTHPVHPPVLVVNRRASTPHLSANHCRASRRFLG